MTYSLNSLSNTLTAKIIEYLDSKTKRELSMVDRRTRAVVLETVRSIRVFPAKYFPHRTHSSDIPQDILVRVICRYPTLERIIFGPPKHIYGCHEFTSQEVPYLKSLISYLESSPEKHPLSSVKKIEFREITKDSFEGFGKKKAKELNNHFLSAISHKDLEKVAIRADNISSILTGAEIQPVLTNSPNLKTFEFNGFQSDQIVTISFASQPELTKVKLLQWRGEVSTIESLRQCAKLEELVIDYSTVRYRSNNSEEIKAILLNDHPWDLKRLVLKGISIENDEEFDALTKKLPNLERLEISLWNISDEGMKLLGRNCPKLKYLKFTQKNLTNSALDGLTQYLPHLEIISFDEASKITNAGIASVGHNCKNLRFIQNGYSNKIEKKEIDALVKSFPRPKAPELSRDGPAPFTKAPEFLINSKLSIYEGSMTYSLNSLSNTLTAKIIEYLDSKTKREFSMVDRRIRAVVLETVRSIRVFRAKYFPHRIHSSDIPEDILVRVICRYPTLERITFGPPKHIYGCHEFTSQEIPYLKSFISYLESAPEKHPLSSVKKIEFREIIESILDRFYERKIKELNNHFLSAISHKDLEKVAIRAYNVSSILTGAEIQPVLTNSPNLKTFEFNGFQSDQIVTISFASQPELTKVKLLQWRGEVSTIESLRQCAKLEELVIDYSTVRYRSNNSEEIKAILLNDHPWDLKRLVLKGISIQNDEEFDALTKKLPNLERLEISLWNISDEGMKLLGRNCPKLKYLEFEQKNLTNSALDGLTQHLPHLEIISFDEASKITNAGIASVGHNCKNLRFIQNGYPNKIEKTEIDALVKSFPRPKAPELSRDGLTLSTKAPELNHDGPAAFTKAALCHIL